MKLEHVDARFLDDPRHLSRQGIDKHADRQHGSLWSGIASGRDTGSRRCRGDLPPRWRKDEPDQIRSGGGGGRGVLRLAQAVDLDDSATGEKPGQSLPVGVYHGQANSA
jgi:hypothetical protein